MDIFTDFPGKLDRVGQGSRKKKADDAGGADVVHAQRLLKALGMTWNLAYRSTSVQNRFIRFGTSPQKCNLAFSGSKPQKMRVHVHTSAPPLPNGALCL